MAIGSVIRRYPQLHPHRSAAGAFLDAMRSMDDVQRQFGFGHAPSRLRGPNIDAVETELAYEITAELPGVDASELEIFVEEGVLTIKRMAAAQADVEEEGEPKTVFVRRIRFNGEIDEEHVRAVHKNGLLTVTVPKPEPAQPEVRHIPVEGS